MSVPDLTHLQIAVLQALGPNEISGRDLRAVLKSQHGISKSGPAFYQLMSRLEDGNFVTGRYEDLMIEGQRIRERRYILTGEGEKARRTAITFYRGVLGFDEI